MKRREFLKLLGTGVAGLVVGSELDLDRLLWVPNTKKIFLPSRTGLTESQIIAAEFERIVPHIQRLFERDNLFYQVLDGGMHIRADRDFRIPIDLNNQIIVEPDKK